MEMVVVESAFAVTGLDANTGEPPEASVPAFTCAAVSVVPPPRITTQIMFSAKLAVKLADAVAPVTDTAEGCTVNPDVYMSRRVDSVPDAVAQ
jgi:hypothetical protein